MTDARDSKFERPILTVDVVLLTLLGGQLTVALAPRASEPFKGEPALLGGYVRVNSDADAEATAERVLREKAGLTGVYVEQLRTFAGRDRDPRGWSASIVYLALLRPEHVEQATKGLILRPADEPEELPFDHNAILEAARERLRTKGAYSTLPARLLPRSFTLPEMQQVYEAVMGEKLDQSSFRRKIAELRAVEPIAGHTRRSSNVRRPAQLYQLSAPIALFDKRL